MSEYLANKANNEIVYSELSWRLMSAIFEVHNKIGNKWREQDFKNALEIIFKKNNISYEREKLFSLNFEGEKFADCKVDFLIEGKIILEIKKIWKITEQEIKQVLRYLDATNLKLAIIANFKYSKIQYKRVVNPKVNIY